MNKYNYLFVQFWTWERGRISPIYSACLRDIDLDAKETAEIHPFIFHRFADYEYEYHMWRHKLWIRFCIDDHPDL